MIVCLVGYFLFYFSSLFSLLRVSLSLLFLAIVYKQISTCIFSSRKAWKNAVPASSRNERETVEGGAAEIRHCQVSTNDLISATEIPLCQCMVCMCRSRVFGADLGEHLENSQRSGTIIIDNWIYVVICMYVVCPCSVPLVVERCTKMIEKYGIVEGVYRLPGISSNVNRLRYVLYRFVFTNVDMLNL